MYPVCTIFIIFALFARNASTVSLPEPYTVLSYRSSPNLNNIQIPDGSQTQAGFVMNIEVDNPEQGLTSQGSDDAGSIYVTVLLPSGTVRRTVIQVSGRPKESGSICLNSGSTPSIKELKVILVSDMKTVKNVTTKIEESSCEYHEPIISGDCSCSMGLFLAVIATAFLVIFFFITIFWFIFKGKPIFFQTLKGKLHDLTRPKSDIENQNEVPSQTGVISHGDKPDVSLSATTEKDAPPRDEFNTIETNAEIVPDKRTGSLEEKKQYTEDKLRIILGGLHLKWKELKFKNERTAKNGQPVINYIVYLDGGEESLDQFVAKVQEDPNQSVVRLNINVRVSMQDQNEEEADNKIRQVLKDKNFDPESNVKYHSRRERNYLFNVDLKGDKIKFELFKTKLEDKYGVRDVEIGTWDSVDLMVTMRSSYNANLETDIKQSLRDAGLRGEVETCGKQVLGNNIQNFKYNVKLFGDIKTVDKFRDHLQTKYASNEPQVKLGKFDKKY